MAEHSIKDTLETVSEYIGEEIADTLEEKENIFRYDTIPTASSTNVGQIIQYTGATTQDYTNGYFYKCVAQGTDPETYAWEAQSVQEGGGGSSDKEDKFRYSTMPEVSAENYGKIYQYIGQTNANFTEGYSYKSDYFYKEYIGNVSDFECSGSSRNYVISTDSITMQTVQNEAQETIVKCIVPMVNKGTLKITKTRVSGDRLNYIYTELGTTSGANDLYTSSNWSSIAVGSTVVEEIDLSQYNASEIYLSFHMIVNSGNNSVFEISSIEQSCRQWLEEEVSRQPQKFTSAEMTEIKNAVSQETANVQIIRPPYSPEEHIVTYWREYRDGVLMQKPVYEKYVFNINVTPGYNAWVNLYNATSLNAERLFIVSIIGGAFNTLNLISSGMEVTLDNGNILAEYNQSTNVREVKEMCFQYTKTTDQWETVE